MLREAEGNSDSRIGETMKTSRMTTIAMLVTLTTSCSQKPMDDKNGAQIETLKQQVATLSQQLQQAQQSQVALTGRVLMLEVWRSVEASNSAELDPTSKSYGVAKTNLGNLLISVDNIFPYADGYKVRLMVGNPNMVTFDGAKLKIQWAEKPRWEDKSFDSAKWNASIQQKDVDVVNNLLPGTWNPIEVVISPATAAQTGYLAVSATLNKLSMRPGF